MTTKTKQPPPIQLPISEKAAVYIRRASVNVTTIGNDLRELNTELLVKLALKAGWRDENLIIFNDTGIPASAPLEKREGLQELITAIERDEIKTVLLSGAYNLYRDATLTDIDFFIELCSRHGVIVATPEMVYDFTNPAHVHLFLFALETAHVTISAQTNNSRKQKRGKQ